MTQDLEQKWRAAEARAQKLMADKDQAIQNVKAKYAEKLQAANDEAHHAQKEYLDAMAADALRDRPDGQAVAQALGLTL